MLTILYLKHKNPNKCLEKIPENLHTADIVAIAGDHENIVFVLTLFFLFMSMNSFCIPISKRFS